MVAKKVEKDLSVAKKAEEKWKGSCKNSQASLLRNKHRAASTSLSSAQANFFASRAGSVSAVDVISEELASSIEALKETDSEAFFEAS